MDPNVFETANAGFAQAIYEEFLRDPTAVDPEWRRLFESGVVGQRDGGPDGQRGSAEVGQRGSMAAGQAEAMNPIAPAIESNTAKLPSGPAASPIKGPAAKLVANMTESLTVPTATTFRELAVGRWWRWGP